MRGPRVPDAFVLRVGKTTFGAVSIRMDVGMRQARMPDSTWPSDLKGSY